MCVCVCVCVCVRVCVCACARMCTQEFNMSNIYTEAIFRKKTINRGTLPIVISWQSFRGERVIQGTGQQSKESARRIGHVFELRLAATLHRALINPCTSQNRVKHGGVNPNSPLGVGKSCEGVKTAVCRNSACVQRIVFILSGETRAPV